MRLSFPTLLCTLYVIHSALGGEREREVRHLDPAAGFAYLVSSFLNASSQPPASFSSSSSTTTSSTTASSSPPAPTFDAWNYGVLFERHRLRSLHASAQTDMQRTLVALNTWSADSLFSECYGKASKYVSEYGLEAYTTTPRSPPPSATLRSAAGFALQRALGAAKGTPGTTPSGERVGEVSGGGEQGIHPTPPPAQGGALPALSFLSSRSTLSLSVGISEDILALAAQAQAVAKASSLALASHGRVVTALLMADPSRVVKALYTQPGDRGIPTSATTTTSSKDGGGVNTLSTCPSPPRLPSLHALAKALDAYIDTTAAALATHSTLSYYLHAVASRGNLSMFTVCPQEWEERRAELRLAAVLEKERAGGGVGSPPLVLHVDPPTEGDPMGERRAQKHSIHDDLDLGGGGGNYVPPVAQSIPRTSLPPTITTTLGGRSTAGPSDFIYLLGDLLEASEDMLLAPVGDTTTTTTATKGGGSGTTPPLSTLSSACHLRQVVTVASRGKGWGGGSSKKEGGLSPSAITAFCATWIEALQDTHVEEVIKGGGEGGGAEEDKGGCKEGGGAARLLQSLGASQWTPVLSALMSEENNVGEIA